MEFDYTQLLGYNIIRSNEILLMIFMLMNNIICSIVTAVRARFES